MKKVFLSYSHEDVKLVKQFAFQLSLRGFDIWMDEKNIALEEPIRLRFSMAYMSLIIIWFLFPRVH